MIHGRDAAGARLFPVRLIVVLAALSLCAFALVPVAAASIPVACSQFVAFGGVDVRCTVDGAPVYAGAGCGTLCTGTEIIECQESTPPTAFSCALPYIFCPYGPICPGPDL